jgi:signal transduction histidine kinase
MEKYIDKAILLALCVVFCLEFRFDIYVAVPFISVIILSALLSYFDDGRIRLAGALLFFAAACFYPVLLFYTPVICYDLYGLRYQYGAAAAVIPAVMAYPALPLRFIALIALLTGLAWLIKRRTTLLEKKHREYITLRDSAKELSMQLESKNKELMDKQDYEIHLATLDERNRIARDIHDNVGHILSNAILQTGALLATTPDEAGKDRLRTLKDTLVTGMDSIRSSIHDLHDESVDLYAELRRLTDGFDFCPITLDYSVDGNPDRQIKYALIAVAKEALSNIIRHSNATQAAVSVYEHPALYQMIVRDNGTKKETGSDGIGLGNIVRRVESLGGIANISDEGGFTVFVSIPKQPREKNT